MGWFGHMHRWTETACGCESNQKVACGRYYEKKRPFKTLGEAVRNDIILWLKLNRLEE